MADDKKIMVDDDWKAQARAEKERLAEQQKSAGGPREGMPQASFIELVNLLYMQALAQMGLMQGAGGERIPPNFEVAKHFIDMLQMFEDKTKGNLSPDEKKALDQALYEVRMRFVQRAGGGAPGPGLGM